MSIDTSKIKVGDRIKFTAMTRWHNGAAIWRKVNGFDHGRPTVRFDWPHFIVRLDEIVEHEESKP